MNDRGIAAFKLVVKHDLFDPLADRSHVPDEKMVPWYQECYYQVVAAARRVKDPYTGASLYFTPHCLRHSFATALAPLIGGDAKTGAKILGHSPQTFMRYVGANDETARAAVEKMAEGLSMAGQLVAVPTTASALYVAGAEGLGLGFLMAGTERTRYRMVFSGEAHPIYAQTSNEITTRCAPFDSSTI